MRNLIQDKMVYFYEPDDKISFVNSLDELVLKEGYPEQLFMWNSFTVITVLAHQDFMSKTNKNQFIISILKISITIHSNWKQIKQFDITHRSYFGNAVQRIAMNFVVIKHPNSNFKSTNKALSSRIDSESI